MDLNGKRVLYINNFAHGYLGGGEVHLLHLIRAALEAGMDVNLAAPASSAIAEKAQLVGAHVFEADLSGSAVVQTTHELRELAYRSRPTIMHGTGYFTNLLARNAGELVVNTVHTMADAPLAENPGMRSRISVRMRALVDRATMRPGVRVVADSSAIAASLPRTGADVRVIHNGVDPAELAFEAKRGMVPQELMDARAAGRPVVGCVSRLERVKGVTDLVAAASRLAELTLDAVVLIAGTGSLKDELRRELVVTSPELRDRVRLLGFVDSAAAFIAACDVFVLPSHSEGFNTTVLEAMALRVPVVATDVGGTAEAIEDGVSGRIVPPRDPDALAAAIAEVLGGGERVRAMTEAAHTRLLERFTVERMTREYLDLYAELIAGEEASA